MTDYKLVPAELIEHVRHARRELTRHEVSPMHVRQRLAQKITDLLAAAPAVQGEPTGQRCEYCDGTGDVHSIDGEWRGVCDCQQPVEQQPDVAQLVDALEEIVKQYPNPNISHEKFRVHACRHAESALAAHRKGGDAP